MENNRCPICNQMSCKRYKSGKRTLFPGASTEDNECFRHRVDWRKRALTLEELFAKLLEQHKRLLQQVEGKDESLHSER